MSHFELVGECSGSSSGTTITFLQHPVMLEQTAFGTATLLVTFMVDGENIQHMCAYNMDTS